MSELQIGFWPFTHPDQARMRATRRLFEYWQGQQSDDKPFRRTDVDPGAMADILPFVILGDIEPDPFRVRFRLVGTSIVEFSRFDFSGRYLDELSYSARDSVDWTVCYRHVHANRQPILGNNEIRFSSGRITIYEFSILPLWRAMDPAGSFIASESYEGFDRLHIPDLNPVESRN